MKLWESLAEQENKTPAFWSPGKTEDTEEITEGGNQESEPIKLFIDSWVPFQAMHAWL